MSETSVETQGTPVETTPVVTPEGTGHPAWQGILDSIPDALHPLIEPELKRWDENFTKEVNKVKEQFAPYKELVDNGIDGDSAVQAIQLVQAIEADPAGVIKLLQNNYNLTPAEAKQVVKEVQAEAGEDDPVQAELKLIKDQQLQLANYLTQKENALVSQQNEANLHKYLAGIKEKFPSVPEDYLIPYIGNGIDGEVAAQKFMDMIENAAKELSAPNSDAPIILGAGGGVPSTRQELSKMSDKDTNALVAQMFEQASKQT